MGDLARAKSGDGRRRRHRSARPGSRCRDRRRSTATISGGGVFQAAVPSNWTSLASKSAIKVVPQNGYGQLNGQTVFSHGVEFGIAKAGSRDLREATNAWLKAVAQSNPRAPSRRDAAGDSDLAAFGDRHAARQPVAARRPGTHRRLHDVPGRWQPVLLPDDRAGEATPRRFRRRSSASGSRSG